MVAPDSSWLIVPCWFIRFSAVRLSAFAAISPRLLSSCGAETCSSFAPIVPFAFVMMAAVTVALSPLSLPLWLSSLSDATTFSVCWAVIVPLWLSTFDAVTVACA
ncbi:hypothetical protein LMG28138_06102 [Pararobbsia alpina]|uniref:Uncharacterized protein n=1 Tax=Pararobbsia alpina TaxID=621374 RepID=A0A6S7BQH4_9BURK|nr:hypothetical protein LMG28138_06102 [Pararobbsia alpina]